MAIDWRGVKRGFELNASTPAELAKIYGCHASTIRRRAAKEGWKKAGLITVDAVGAFETAPIDALTKAKAEGLREAEDGKQAVDSDAPPQTASSDHQILWQGVKKRLVRGLETRDVKAGLDELKVAKLAGEVLTSVIKGERLAMGLAGGEYDEVSVTDGDTAEMEAATASCGTGEVVDGE
ncbi:MAG: hypothetical protein A3J24_08290 [Deltaproteobacteria bacterium RIFCSPLOWO2_02_FULL_53_8]|nr:MAG: hypothetical protein A3J24_08290 [Deltaproteobacteria bacterium RIFCSPLOWO2_02_FULL_53_8]